MKVGINILNFGPGIGPDAALGWARVAESLGYHGLFISDHVAITPSVRQRYPEPFYDPLMTLAWLAGQTRHVDLGTTVIVLPYRHPVLLARHVANLDHFSGGRVILGVGVGNALDEFAVLGAPHPRRGAWSNDAIAVLKALFTQDEVTYHGEEIAFERVSGIQTLQRPHPPIWVGGNSESALRRAVRVGDAWHPINMTPAALRDAAKRLREASAAIEGRSAGKTPLAFCPRIRLDLTDAPVTGTDRPAGKGTLEQVHADLREIEALGAAYVVLDWYNWPDIEGTKDHARGWRMLATLAEKALDLKNGKVR